MENDNGKNKRGITPRDLTHKETKERIDLYSKGDQEQFFKVQKIKNDYEKEMADRTEKRNRADLFYSDGVRKGLPHAPFQDIKYDREKIDQQLRDQVIAEAKAEYRKHDTFSKDFNKDNRERNQEKEEKERGQTEPVERKNLSKHFKKQIGKAPEQGKSKGMNKDI